jgi:hypothetical protein
MHAGFSFSYPPISLLLRQPLSIKKSYAGAIQRYRIFDAGGHMIQSEHMKSCLAAQKRFLLFKGPGSFKIFFFIGGNVEDKQAYRLIPRTPPLPGHFTVPLI